MALFDQVTKLLGASGSTQAAVTARGTKGAVAVEIVDASGNQITALSVPQLVTAAFDYVEISSSNSNGDPLIILYKTGGPSGTLVATLTMTYDVNFNLATITKT